MAKQLLREGIWRSGRLRRCSLESHLAFPFLFPIADHWGRWEYDVPYILSVVNVRGDIGLEKLQGWLAELEKHGLFRRYAVGEKLYAAWMNYAGMPVSQRSPSLLPPPPFDNSMADAEGTESLPRPYVEGSLPLDIGGGVGGGVGGGKGGGKGAGGGEAPYVPHQEARRPGPAEARCAGQGSDLLGKLLLLMAECSDGKPEERIFRFWQLATGKPRAALTDPRRRAIRQRLREEAAVDEKAPVEGIFRAVAGAVLDPHFSGDNERSRRYWEFENIFVHEGRNRIERLQAAFDRASMGVPARLPEKPRTKGGKVADWLKAKHRGDA